MPPETAHTITEVELENLRHQLLLMGELVQMQVRNAVQAFMTGDVTLAEGVFQRERDVNAMEVRLDNDCAELIVLRQPTAVDLRRVLMAIKVISSLEQVGDHAKKIAKHTVALSEMNVVSARKTMDIETLAEESLEELRKGLAAYADLDAGAAQAVIDREQALEDRYQGIARQVMSFAMEDPRLMSWALLVSSAAKAAERVGHQAANIAQSAIYAAEARDVRHRSLAQSAA
ncbi:MAG: phosphate signaling complex protein PhoU [Betaproteobacteria bacterium]